MKPIITTLTLLGTLMFMGCDSKPESTPNTQAQTPAKPKEITLQALTGERYTITYGDGAVPKFSDIHVKELAGKVILFDFWSTNCPPCRAEIPHLNNLVAKYKEDFVVLGILVEDRSLESIRDFAKEYAISYPVVDPGPEWIMTKLVGGVRGIPAMFLYDPNGKYFTHYLGAVPERMIENDIKRILGK